MCRGLGHHVEYFLIVDLTDPIDQPKNGQTAFTPIAFDIGRQALDLAELEQAEPIDPAFGHALRHATRNARVGKPTGDPAFQRLGAGGDGNE